MMTDEEHAAVDLLGRAAEKIRVIIGDGVQADYDWAEAAHHIHALQAMVLSQSARREYPTRYRLLGELGNWSSTTAPQTEAT